MAKLPILTFPSASLKKESAPVEKVTSKIVDLVHDMFETMEHADGIGLAAPQGGENLNILVMNVPLNRDDDDKEPIYSGPLCFINPKIISASGKIQYEEGCLSCPELLVKVDRSQNLLVEALDVDGKLVQHNLADLMAVCLQHEMDHLKGKLLTDYISRLKRDFYKKQRLREKENEFDLGDV